MTTDNMGATLLDDNCLEDIFTLQSQFLDDFEFGLEANNIDTLLQLFEEEEHKHKEASKVTDSDSASRSVDRTDNDTQIKVSMPRVSKSKTSASDVSSKRKGVSLLAKPKKSPAKRSLISVSDADSGSMSSDTLKDHDYCLMDGQSSRFYNKLPDYLTEFSTISKAMTNSANYSSTESYDKIPNYIKGFLNLTESADSRQLMDNNDILIELNEGYIEVSDVVFDNDLYSNDKTDFGEDFNSSTSSSNLSFVESKDNFDDNECERQQHSIRSNSFSDSNDKSSDRRSRSRSREQRSFRSRNQRRRRLSTRSSVDSNSDSSSSCSSCSECDSYSSRNSDDSKVNFKLSNSIIRNDTKGQQMSRKRSLKESFCQKGFKSKIRANFESNCYNESVINVKSSRNSLNNSQDIEERKIIYVGKIPDGTTKTDIRCWFGRFGAIKEVSIHFRDRGDNYAFVTFHRRSDAFEAIEHANDDTRHPKFDLSFGGRRQFCKTRYEDLDFAEDEQPFGYDRMDFDALLRTTQAKLNR